MSTYTTGSPRKGVSERITGVIWGAIVTAVGALLIAALSGYVVDLELVAIVSLAALGGWLLFSAIAVAARQRPAQATAWDSPPAPTPAPAAEPEPQPEPEPEPGDRTDR